MRDDLLRAGRRLLAATLAATLVAAASGTAVAGGPSPHLVRDINAGGSSDPRQLTDVGGMLYFTAAGPGGRELWKSDGSEAGTRRVKDIRPGAAGSNPLHLVAHGGIVYFSANDGTSGRELWKSDGTAAGTVRVKDIRPGAAGSDPRWLASYAGRLYLSANDGAHGAELWRSDGTPAGTKMFKDINPYQGSGPHRLVVANGSLFFVADASGNEPHWHGFPFLWKSDGTKAGTKLVPGTGGGLPGDLVPIGDLLFYATQPSKAGGPELWRTDGTRAGTKRLLGNEVWSLTKVAGQAFFGATNGLWKSNGTASGTGKVTVLRRMVEIFRVGTRAFITSNAVHDDSLAFLYANRLWVSNGTASGTQPVGYWCVADAIGLGDKLYFSGGVYDTETAACDGELSASDGTEPGTMLIADLNGSGSSWPRHLTKVGGALYFTADDGIHGRELWRYSP